MPVRAQISPWLDDTVWAAMSFSPKVRAVVAQLKRMGTLDGKKKQASTDSLGASAPPQVIGEPYKLSDFDKLHEIGSGTFGSVALYRHRLTNTPVVIKSVNKMRTFAMRQQRSVLQEKNALTVCLWIFDVDVSEH